MSGAASLAPAETADGGALVAMLGRWAPRADRALALGAVAATVACLAAVPFVEGWAARRYLLLYLAPLFAACGWWARGRLRDPGAAAPGRLAADAAVLAVAAVRMAGAYVPLSGHMMFLTHAAGTARGPVRLLALAMLLETTWFKLVVWRDPASWALGLAAGLAAAVTYRRLPAGTRPLLP